MKMESTLTIRDACRILEGILDNRGFDGRVISSRKSVPASTFTKSAYTLEYSLSFRFSESRLTHTLISFSRTVICKEDGFETYWKALDYEMLGRIMNLCCNIDECLQSLTNISQR